MHLRLSRLAVLVRVPWVDKPWSKGIVTENLCEWNANNLEVQDRGGSNFQSIAGETP